MTSRDSLTDEEGIVGGGYTSSLGVIVIYLPNVIIRNKVCIPLAYLGRGSARPT